MMKPLEHSPKSSAPRFRSAAALVLLLTCLQLAACKTEMLRTKDEKIKEDAASGQGAVKIVPGADIDDAQLVLRACGQPSADRVFAVYNRSDNGPIRRIVYPGTQEIT